MTQYDPYGSSPPQFQGMPPDVPLNYQTVPPDSTARTMLRLMVIFNFIMAGIDGLYGLLLFGMAIFIPYILAHEAARGGGAPPPPGWLFAAVYGGMGVLSVGVGIVKMVAAFKVLRRRPKAWGWALAAGIVGCPQLWCSVLLVLPLAAAIFTIVVLCRQDVRQHLQSAGSAGNSGVFAG